MRIARYIANVAATLVPGVLLARYIANLPVEWPWLTGSIRFALRLPGIHAYDNPDDMFDLVGVVNFFACLIVVGLVMSLVNIGTRHYRAQRRDAHGRRQPSRKVNGLIRRRCKEAEPFRHGAQ